MTRLRDFFWHHGFALFVAFKHPQFWPLKKLRALARFLWHPRRNERHAWGGPKTPPNTIWMYWGQGWKEAPPLVRACRASWERHNPDWKLVLLDDATVAEHVDMPDLSGKEISKAAYSDLLRLALLTKHGGVWVDAAAYASAPLDAWFPEAMQAGFFAFEKEKTTVASWFIAAEAGNGLVAAWDAYARRYWRYAKEAKRYFWVHYLFEYLIFLSPRARHAWQRVPKHSSVESYEAQLLAKKEGPSAFPEAVALLSRTRVPVSKLDWKMEGADEFARLLSEAC